MAEFLPPSKTHIFCMITICCILHRWDGVGWGGMLTFNGICTLTSCTLPHVHLTVANSRHATLPHVHLNVCVVHRWGGVGC